jgi:hypothetical protein
MPPCPHVPAIPHAPKTLHTVHTQCACPCIPQVHNPQGMPHGWYHMSHVACVGLTPAHACSPTRAHPA